MPERFERANGSPFSPEGPQQEKASKHTVIVEIVRNKDTDDRAEWLAVMGGMQEGLTPAEWTKEQSADFDTMVRDWEYDLELHPDAKALLQEMRGLHTEGQRRPLLDCFVPIMLEQGKGDWEAGSGLRELCASIIQHYGQGRRRWEDVPERHKRYVRLAEMIGLTGMMIPLGERQMDRRLTEQVTDTLEHFMESTDLPQFFKDKLAANALKRLRPN